MFGLTRKRTFLTSMIWTFLIVMQSIGPVSAAIPAYVPDIHASKDGPMPQHLVPRGAAPIPLGKGAAWNSSGTETTQTIIWGDIDNDGDLDLILGNTADYKLKMYTTSNGMLSSAPTWVSNEQDDTRTLALGDYDGDGDLDLAIGNNGFLEAQKEKIYRNENGTLSKNSVWSSDEKDMTNSIAWGDIDMDGDLDLVVGNWGKVRLYRNDGGQMTTWPVWNSSSSFGANSIALADFDKDKDLDLAIGNGGGPNVNCIIRNNNGAFEDYTFWNSTEADDTSVMAWVDYDKDGDLDLSAGNWDTTAVRLWRNDNGVIGKTAVWSSTAPLGVRSMAWGDYDNDGDQDLATGNYDHNVTVFRNDNGVITKFAAWNSTHWDNVNSVAAGDFDMDGDIDLAVSAIWVLRLYRNDFKAFMGINTWTSAETGYTKSVALGDYDNDGDLDLAVGNTNMFAQNMVYRNDNGVFTSSAVWNSQEYDWTSAIAWVDYDGDGDLDLSTGSTGFASFGYLRIYRNDNGTLNTWAVWNSSIVQATESLAWGDYDNDGDPDLMAGNAGQWGEVNRLYRNDNGTMTANAVWSSTETDFTYAVAWCDYDNDGDLDLSVGNSGVNRLYHNDNGTLSNKGSWSSAELDQTHALAWGDYDNDGDPDLAVGNTNERIRIYRNDAGVLKKEAVWSSTSNDKSYALVWADMDRDGDLDLVTGNLNSPSRIYRNNNGVMGQTAAWNASSSEATTSLAVGDLDKDGDLDVVIGTSAVSGSPRKAYETRMGSLSNNPPRVTLPPLQGHYKGDVKINFTLYDPESDPVTVSMYYSTDGGAVWQRASRGASGEGTNRLSSSPSGKAHTFTWASDEDGVNSTNCIFRIFAMDHPSVGVYQKIPFSTMTSSITVTNYWPRYSGGIVSQIVNEDTVWSLDLEDHFTDNDDLPIDLSFTFDYEGYNSTDPQLVIDPVTHVASWSPVHGDGNLKNVVFRAFDKQGHCGASVAMILFYLEVNEAPIFNGTLDPKLRLHDADVSEDTKWFVDLDDYFWDEEKDAGLIFTANSSAVAIDPVTHLASWEPVHGDVSVRNLVFSAMDADDTMMTVSSLPINLTYVEVNDQWPVYVGGLGDTLVYEDKTWAIDLDSVFYDEESNPALFDGSLSFTCLDANITINDTTHVASWTPGNGNSTLFSLVFKAHDPLRPWRNVTSPPITLYYVEVNDQMPRYLGGLPNETTVDEDTAWTAKLGDHFRDEESGSALVYRSDSQQLTVDPVTFVASWHPVHGSADLIVNITAVDPLNFNWSVTHTIALRYREINDQAPVFKGGLQGDVVLEGTVWISDMDDYFSDEEGAHLTFTTSHEAIIINDTTHAASWSPVHGSVTLVAVRFMAFDGKFTSETAPITLTYQEVNDKSPVYLGGLKNASTSHQRVWKVDLDNYFTDEENPTTLIFTCNKKEVKIDPITHEATWSPSDDKVTKVKNVVFRAYDPQKGNQTAVSEALTLKVPPVPTDYVVQFGPIGLTILDLLAYGFSGVSFIVGIYYSTKKIRLTKTHKEKIKSIKDIKALKTYYKKNIRPDIEAEKVTPVQGMVLKDAVEERAIKLKRRSGDEVDLDETARTTPSSEDLENMDEGTDGPAIIGPGGAEGSAIPEDKEIEPQGTEEE